MNCREQKEKLDVAWQLFYFANLVTIFYLQHLRDMVLSHRHHHAELLAIDRKIIYVSLMLVATAL